MHFAEFMEEKLFMQPGDEPHGSQYFVLYLLSSPFDNSSTTMPIPAREPSNLSLGGLQKQSTTTESQFNLLTGWQTH